MLNEWFLKNYFVYALSGICAIGLLIKLVTNLVYWRLLRASGNMASSNNKLVKLMKMKFEMFYKLKIGVHNVDIFVDKYVYRHRFCGLLLSTWENLSGLMLILCLLIAPIASVLGVIVDCGRMPILYTFFAGVATSALLIIVDNLFNINAKKKLIKVNMKDYLDNYLKARLEQEAANPEVLERYREEMQTKEEIAAASSRRQKKEARALAKEEKEQQKLLQLEQKQQEREELKREKQERKQAAAARREEDKLRKQEESRLAAEEKAEAKRRAIEEKRQKETKIREEEQRAAKQLKMAKEQKASQKRQEQERKLGQEAKLAQLMKEREQQDKLAKAHPVTPKPAVSEIAAAKETRRKGAKQDKIKERNERLKEELQAQREIRKKELEEGKNPFDVYNGTKSCEDPKSYHVNDFNMEHEMRMKAAKREEEKQKSQELAAVAVEQAAAAKEASQKVNVEAAAVSKEEEPVKKAPEKKAPATKGSTPYEDKVIDDILKEFLA